MSLLSEVPVWPDGVELPQLWEYTVVAGIGIDPLSNISPQLDGFGRQGWELVAVSGAVLFFKRPLVTKPVRQR